jgi:hypothetical protein
MHLPGNTFNLAKSGQELCRPWHIFLWDINKDPLYNLFSYIKVCIWHPAKGISRVFNWLKILGGIMHLKPTAGCQIQTLIFENKLWRWVSINIPYKYIMNGKFRPWHIFLWDINKDPLHNLFSNIKVCIWHPSVGLRCIIPPRHLCQLKSRAIPLT